MGVRASLLILAAAAGTAAAVPVPAAGRTSSFLIYTCTMDDFDGELCRVDADGRNRRRLTHDAGGPAPDYLAPSLSADSKRLAFVRYRSGVFVARADASHRRRVASGLVIDAAVSPAGHRVAYVEERSGGDATILWTVNADGSNRRRIGEFNHPAWLGRKLLAIPGAPSFGYGRRLCVVDERSGACGRTVAKRPGFSIGSAAVSRDGRAVAAETTNPDGFYDGIFAFATATGHPLRPLVYGSVPEDPAWGPTRAAYAYSDRRGIYLREPRLDGAGYPVDKGNDTFAVNPVWGGTMGDRNPKLRITSMDVEGDRLTVRGTIARKARGLVRADFDALGNLPSPFDRTYWHRPRDGRFRFSHAIEGSCVVFLGYAGDKTYSWDNASRTTRAGQCP